MRRLLSQYLPGYSKTIVYMLQASEYQIKPYLTWYWRVKDFTTVMYRRSLDKTKPAALLLLALSAGMLAQVVVGLWLSWQGYIGNNIGLTSVGLLVILSYPVVWAHAIAVPLVLGRLFIINPRQNRLIKESHSVFANHPATKIAIAGSYGKTSMKELLDTVLSEGKKVAATPANKNVSVSHAYFAKKLSGQEDVLLIEYGESKPGDVENFAKITSPDKAVITGLAPAHLDNYPDMAAAGKDIFSVAKAVGDENVYVNADSPAAKPFVEPSFNKYSYKEALGWRISNIKVSVLGTSFDMKKGSQKLRINSRLLGRHQVGPLGLAAALASELGLSKQQIESGAAKTEPFEHRMQARQLKGAWILDDTYNGNIDGMKAGLALLEQLSGQRKIYVTPGLVDQGVEKEPVHQELGRAIAKANPDRVVLMHNSVTDYIAQGLESGGYRGDLQVEHYPLDFYVNLEHFVAAGDVVMLQNDWTDNYN